MFPDLQETPTRTLATEILDTSDDIAYAVHDFEDGVWAGLIPLFRLLDPTDERVRVELDKLLLEKAKLFPDQNAIRQTLDAVFSPLSQASWASAPFDRSLKSSADLKNFCAALIEEFIVAVTPNDAFTAPSGLVEKKLVLLKALAQVWMIENHETETLRFGQRRVLRDLFEGYWERPEMLPLRSEWRDVPDPEIEDFDYDHPYGTDRTQLPVWRAKARLICDHIAGMTDLYALYAHAEMFGGGAAPSLRLTRPETN